MARQSILQQQQQQQQQQVTLEMPTLSQQPFPLLQSVVA
jgi:hypothetical protein